MKQNNSMHEQAKSRFLNNHYVEMRIFKANYWIFFCTYNNYRAWSQKTRYIDCTSQILLLRLEPNDFLFNFNSICYFFLPCNRWTGIEIWTLGLIDCVLRTARGTLISHSSRKPKWMWSAGLDKPLPNAPKHPSIIAKLSEKKNELLKEREKGIWHIA